MEKYIQKIVKTEKHAPENLGKTLGKNVEIPYNKVVESEPGVMPLWFAPSPPLCQYK